VVALAFLAARELFPTRPWLWLATMAFVAFLPQHAFMLAGVNNDALAELLIAATLWLLLRRLRGRAVPVWWLGLLVGLGLATKTTTYILLAIVPLGLLLEAWVRRGEGDEGLAWRPLVRDLAVFALPALLIGGLWWLRNLGVYGWPDFLGLAAHDRVVIGQPRTADWIADMGLGPYLAMGARTTFNSFWGQFGWMALPLEERLYAAFGLLSAVALAGLAVAAWRPDRDDDALVGAARRRAQWAVLWATIGLGLAAFLYYNTSFVQFQGRYLFSALIPLAALFALGVDAWRRLLLGRWPATRWLTVLVFCAFALVDMYMMARYFGALGPG
jgi:hypothetical protein